MQGTYYALPIEDIQKILPFRAPKATPLTVSYIT